MGRHTNAGSRDVWVVVPVKEPVWRKPSLMPREYLSGMQACMLGFLTSALSHILSLRIPCIFYVGQEAKEEMRAGTAIIFQTSDRRPLL